MKIAYILNTYPQPSHSFIRREIAALEAAGHEVLRFAMRGPDVLLVDGQDKAEEARSHYVLAAGGAALAHASLRSVLRSPRRFGKALREVWHAARRAETGMARHLIYLAEACYLQAQLDGSGTEHLHAHFGTNATMVAMLCHLLGGPRYSFTTHGPEEFDSPRALSLSAKIHHSAFAVAISQFGRSQLCRWADPADWPRIKVVHCGIEPAKFPAPAALPDGPRRLVSIGRFVEQKGQLALIDAMARLRDSHPDLHLTLIGDGPLRRAIETEIARHTLQNRITLTGWVDEARVTSELSAAHALVMPSFAEGLPMVVMEAMAAARPVIATYIAGTPELVQPGQTGWLVPAGDVAALAEAMTALHDAPLSTLEGMGANARARVFARHDVSREAAKLADFMQDAAR
ncbi:MULTISPECIES: glycosyltransferase [unclassified Sulfitobacter]|uniref:glycosyltransferase n=1 Tax=unclassified Sulfitobacter TaxID=196795 RepID=UPI0007C2C417|nr:MULTISPECIES: glycosyltransferase [unclassified Sulfitobacter]KZX99940.1 colanic acid biosynthesis glycosyltransferase WcaL [Sulfitobacter sp. HI0021]KZY04036.1 colanic acid biosynthesis glycosyltransferase WcaL [Sulfitobacter sp. HI0027]KZZ02806.1 colanic acid biosynthesis glycosyltransferase WcaL [Sulfitobacter sp. HI0076]